MQIGLEGIAFDIPEHFIDMRELAGARGVDPAKYLQGLGQLEMAVASPCEDSVVLAAGAGRRLFANFDVDPSSISLLIVGTETGIDHSLSIASYLHLMLGLSDDCRIFEIKQACYGAMAGVAMGINYLLSGKALGKKVLVVATDIARYGQGSSGEATQGAGAVALLLSHQPRLVEWEARIDGYYARHVMDFWRPLDAQEACVEGHYSIDCYLAALEGAYRHYKANGVRAGLMEVKEDVQKRCVACLYHVPYVKMAQKAHIKLLELEAGCAFEKESPVFAAAREDFCRRTLPFLELNSRVGNVYTASLFLSLLNFLEIATQEAVGKELSLFSYGSGCGAEFVRARVSVGATKWMQKDSFRTRLAARRLIGIGRYEEMATACRGRDKEEGRVYLPEKWNLTRSELYLGVKGRKRVYAIDGKILE